ncbi:NADH:riboflavin 5'-phosphate oxidoreductase [Streptomyces sp. YIM 130001]|uniref:flavin reductase family protein n=1 Tax=Streptomyces sp. YIM 130001 TaxID=2259644 RepID=UPI000E648A12|nr:flavin reductase family protein [Streptomyces sp. YIM 130001]RII13431.1 NADH:riboflavin 5'-phosphate oxidoreductase [Streptomyces sp. YIM 130001]
MTAVQEQTRPVVSAQDFRDAMAQLAAPVSIVTTLAPDGRRRGFTASSVTSVSLEPPLIMVGIALTSSCHATLTTSEEFVVNVLGEEHRSVARRFATQDVDRFTGGGFAAWQGTGTPYLPDAALLIRCRTERIIRAGDHDLVFGTPREICSGPGAAGALLWFRRGFHTAREHDG